MRRAEVFFLPRPDREPDDDRFPAVFRCVYHRLTFHLEEEVPADIKRVDCPYCHGEHEVVEFDIFGHGEAPHFHGDGKCDDTCAVRLPEDASHAAAIRRIERARERKAAVLSGKIVPSRYPKPRTRKVREGFALLMRHWHTGALLCGDGETIGTWRKRKLYAGVYLCLRKTAKAMLADNGPFLEFQFGGPAPADAIHELKLVYCPYCGIDHRVLDEEEAGERGFTQQRRRRGRDGSEEDPADPAPEGA